MWLGMVVGGGLGWLAVERTADGSLARFLVDERTAWLYVAALALVLAIGAAASPKVVAGVAGGLSVGLIVAATVTLRPSTPATSADLGPALAVAAAIALAGALLGGLQPSRDGRHPVRRPWSRRARKARAAIQAPH